MSRIIFGATVLAILAIAGASQFQRLECLREQTLQTRIYEAKIKQLIISLRDKLKVGIPEKNIPPMDPLVLKDFRLQLNQEWAQLDWNMTGQITGLMGFEPTDVKMSIAGMKVTVGLLFDAISGQGLYGISGSLLGLLPVYGSGNFDVEADGLKVLVKFQIGSEKTETDPKLFLKNVSVEVVLKHFEFIVTGLMDNEDLSKLISQMLSDSLPDLIQAYQTQINKIASEKLTEYGDKFLENKTISDILGMLRPSYKPYTIHCGDP